MLLPFISTGSNRNRYAASQVKKKKKERKKNPPKQRGTEARPEKKRDGSRREQKEKIEAAPVFRDVTGGEKRKNARTFVQIIRTTLEDRGINVDANAVAALDTEIDGSYEGKNGYMKKKDTRREGEWMREERDLFWISGRIYAVGRNSNPERGDIRVILTREETLNANT